MVGPITFLVQDKYLRVLSVDKMELAKAEISKMKLDVVACLHLFLLHVKKIECF